MKNIAPRLGVNIDHVATLRQARRSPYPDPFSTLEILKKCQVDQVTIHLREDRRHIQDNDLSKIVAANVLPVNLELAVVSEMLAIACEQKPATVTFVPERREEITTEGGLDVANNFQAIDRAVSVVEASGIRSRLFIGADPDQVRAAAAVKCEAIELHTGSYCHVFEECFRLLGHNDVSQDAMLQKKLDGEFARLKQASKLAKSLGLRVFAGHGLTLENLPLILKITEIEEYNIGHSIISHAVFVGLEKAVLDFQHVLAAG